MNILRSSPKSMVGLSLIELMVSMTISLIVLAGVVQSFISSKKAFLYEEQVAYIQENARFAIDLLTRDVREAGYFGCNRPVNTAISIGSSYNGLVSTTALEGFDNGSLPTAIATSNTGTDSFIVRRARTDQSFVVDSHNGSSAQISILGTHNHPPGTIMLLASPDCWQVGIFEMTSPNASSLPAGNVVHNQGGGVNCTNRLSGNFDCADTSGSSNASYPDGSNLFIFSTNAYFIGPSSFDATLPALHRVFMNGASGPTTEELISGIEDMQVVYGEDTDGDNQANQYRAAGAVTDWNQVVSVRLQLLMRSRNEILPKNNTATYLGSVPSDRFLRQVVSTTIRLRNMGVSP